MSDIDEELLALAGDASSDDEGGSNHSASRSPARDNTTSRKAPATSRSRDISRDDSPASDRSAPMDESDSESDSGTPTFGEGDRYPLEGKYKDAADRAEILAMPEIKREELLAERASQTERDRQNRALRQLLMARDQEQKLKRKHESEDMEEGSRKTNRQRTKVGGGRVGEQSSGIDSLKRARDEKADRQRRRQEDLERNGPRKIDERQSEDEQSDNDGFAWDQPPKKDTYESKIVSTPADMADLEKIRIGRAFLSKNAFYPGWEDALKGAFVRLCIGTDKSGKVQVYRIAEILGFVTGKPYPMEKPNGQTMMVDVHVKLAHGKAVRDWPMNNCSNSPFIPEEWKRFYETCEIEKVKIPTREAIQEKLKEISLFNNRSWTDAEITARLKRTGTLNLRGNVTAVAKYKKQLAEARVAGDDVKARQLEGIIAQLEPAKAMIRGNTATKRSGPAPPPLKAPVKEETEEERMKREAEEIRRVNEAAIAREENLRRMREKSMAIRAAKAGKLSGTVTPQEQPKEVKKDEVVESLLPQVQRLQKEQLEKTKFGELPKELTEDQVLGAIDFGVDIEL